MSRIYKPMAETNPHPKFSRAWWQRRLAEAKEDVKAAKQAAAVAKKSTGAGSVAYLNALQDWGRAIAVAQWHKSKLASMK